MKLEKQLTIIAVISLIITAVLFFILERKAGANLFNTAVELMLMAGMTFLIITINFFAIRFILRKFFGFFRKS